MAGSRGTRARLLARRFGLTGRSVAVLALVALLVAVIGGVALTGASTGGVSLERADAAAEQEQEPPGSGDDAVEVDADAGEGDGDAETGDGTVPVEDGEPEVIVVHVDGAVAAPGVYELAAGSRAADAVAVAGGLAEGADTSQVNLAAPLADGEKLRVPLVGEEAPAQDADVGVTEVTSSGEAASGPININTATAAELDELPGVGEATAASIVEDREKNGPFASVEDLMRVSGIGEKKLERMRELICV